MRIVIAHNHYGQFATGGEGASAREDVRLLRERGHNVYLYERTNFEMLSYGFLKKLAIPRRILYSRETYREATKIFKEFKPDILHVNNYKYLFTPSIFQAAKDCDVKTVLTLRNYRLICPCALLCCDEKACERCISGFPWRVLWNRCVPYETSFFQRALQLYFCLGTNGKVKRPGLVDAFISLTPFAKSRYVAGGMSAKKIYVRPNFMNCPSPISTAELPSSGAICVGRLSPEKGVDFLIDAWRDIDYPLTVVGTGPLAESLKKNAPPQVTFTGNLPHDEMMKRLAKADFLIFPSICYETFGRTIIEAFSLKIPVVASDLGPRRDLITSGINGLLFESLNKEDLKKNVMKLVNCPDFAQKLGRNGWRTFNENYTPEVNYDRLMTIYNDVLSENVNAANLEPNTI